MIHPVVKHLEWIPQPVLGACSGRHWIATYKGITYGYVRRVGPSTFEAKARGGRNFRYFRDIHSAGRHVVADANYCYPGQLPR